MASTFASGVGYVTHMHFYPRVQRVHLCSSIVSAKVKNVFHGKKLITRIGLLSTCILDSVCILAAELRPALNVRQPRPISRSIAFDDYNDRDLF